MCFMYMGISFNGVAIFFCVIQGVLPPVMLAQFGNNWEVLELLTERYGCTINLSVLSHVQVADVY